MREGGVPVANKMATAAVYRP